MIARVVVMWLRAHAFLVANRNAPSEHFKLVHIPNSMGLFQIGAVGAIHPAFEFKPDRWGMHLMIRQEQVQLRSQLHGHIRQCMTRRMGFVIAKSLSGELLQLLELVHGEGRFLMENWGAP